MTRPDTPARVPPHAGCRTADLDSATLTGRVAELGEYFRLTAADGSGWQPIAALWADADAVRGHVARTRRAIADAATVDVRAVPVKVAASAWQLAIASRLLSPMVGATMCLPAVPLLTPERLRWRRGAGHVPDLGAVNVEWVDARTPREAAVIIATSLVGRVLGPLNDTLRTAAAVSSRVTWGNVASAANGAVTVASSSRLADRERGLAVVRALIDTPPLRGSADMPDGHFHRRNCCLFYLAPQGGYCGDCVLTAGRATLVQRAAE